MDRNTDIGNVMPKVFYPNGSIQFLCKLLPTPYDWIGRRFNPFKRLVETRNELFELRFSKYEKQMNVPYLSGCFMFLRLDALSKVGLFDENIFMYGEETDLGRRLIQSGYRNVFFPNVNIYHEFQKGSHKSWRLTLIGMKSAIYYFNKWGWFFDKSRTEINERCLKELLYNG
jgi:GT2 family glycosyltransferase